MKIHLASADVEEIRWASENGLLDGVITPLPLLSREEVPSERELLTEICHAAGTPVFVTVHAGDSQSIYRLGKELARLSDQIVVQVPLVEEAIQAIRRLYADGVRVAAMLVFNAAQGLLAAKVGATSVITPIAHLDRIGYSGVQVVSELRSVFDAGRTECDIIAVRPATATQLADCVLAGADGVAVSIGLLRNLMVHPLTNRGVDQLLDDLSRQHRSWVDM